MRNLIIAIIFIVAYSCTKDYDLQLKSNLSKLVVEGTVTNQNGPYLIRLTKSKTNFDPFYDSIYDTTYSYNYDGAKPVIDAKVYITDINTSFTDTLIKCPIGKLWYYKDPNTNKEYSHYYAADTSILMGYYKTTKLKGMAGHTYSLTVEWQNNEYHAVSYMAPVPPLDSVQFKFTFGAFGKFDYNIPLIYFKEPQNERNYYLFITQGNSSVWPYSILSDEYLKDYVNGLDVCKGISPDYWMTAYPHSNRDGSMDDYFIEMHSLTKEAYDYYKALIQQFKTDGGGYSPSPSSPPTNLDNGALGYFRASAVNRVDFKEEVPNQDGKITYFPSVIGN